MTSRERKGLRETRFFVNPSTRMYDSLWDVFLEKVDPVYQGECEELFGEIYDEFEVASKVIDEILRKNAT